MRKAHSVGEKLRFKTDAAVFIVLRTVFTLVRIYGVAAVKLHTRSVCIYGQFNSVLRVFEDSRTFHAEIAAQDPNS